MVTLKSQVSVYADLVCRLIRCDPLQLSSPKYLSKDIETVMDRYQSEGLPFLTKTLPKLGKALDLGLSSAFFTCPHEFKRSSRHGSTPAFMQAYFKKVFDEKGVLRDEADPQVVKHLRQVLLFAYKLQVPYEKKVEVSVLETFISNDANLEFDDTGESASILDAASYIIRNIFKGFNPKDIIPRHGPGAVATGERLEEKWTFRRLYSSIHQSYAYYDYYIVGGASELIDRLEWYKSLTRLDEGCAKVVLVPKDSRGPRLISAEPLEFQWIQQGLGRKIVSHLESHWLTRGNINFTHQEVNQKLALDSSVSDAYSTIDLKDASDKVSLTLVRRLFSQQPMLLKCLEACRTTSTRLPDGRVIALNKYAPMGSALCFPVEALVFWSIMVAAICRETRRPLALVGKEIFVYGDDIIVPRTYALLCIHALERFALQVNRDKSCIMGSFRESCGVEAFKGINITPSRIRIPWTDHHREASTYSSYVALANKFLAEDAYRTCGRYLVCVIEQTYGKIPYGTANSSFPSITVNSPQLAEIMNRPYFRRRFSRDFQRFEFLLPLVTSVRVKSNLDSWPRLLRDVNQGIGDDPSHVSLPRITKITRGWAAC